MEVVWVVLYSHDPTREHGLDRCFCLPVGVVEQVLDVVVIGLRCFFDSCEVERLLLALPLL